MEELKDRCQRLETDKDNLSLQVIPELFSSYAQAYEALYCKVCYGCPFRRNVQYGWTL